MFSDDNYDALPRNPQAIISFIRTHKVPFLYTPARNTPPLKESIPYTLALIICPTLQLPSITNLIAAVLIIIYSIAVSTGVDTTVSILQITTTSLMNFGANNPQNVYHGQVYRLISAAFLSPSLPSLLNSLLILYLLLPRLEDCTKMLTIALVSFFSMISGNILQDLASKNPYQISAGPSTILFGYVGLLTAYFIVNWDSFNALGMFKSQLGCTVLMINIFALIFAFYSSPAGIDYYGHLGGYIGGIFTAMIFLEAVDKRNTMTYKIAGATVLGAYLLTIFLVFYLAKY